MADQSLNAMFREVVAERDALRRKCSAYKQQLNALTKIHRIVKREWLDWSHAASVAWMKHREAQKHPGSLGWRELTLTLQHAYDRIAKLERENKELRSAHSASEKP